MSDVAVQRLVDESAIRDVLARTFRGYDMQDVELAKSTYWPEASFSHFLASGNAWDCHDEMAKTLWPQTEASTHNLAQTLMRVDGDVAGCESFVSVFLRVRGPEGDPLPVITTVRMLDRMERRDGEWRIFDRKVLAEWELNLEFLIGKGGVNQHFSQPRKGREDESYELLGPVAQPGWREA